MRDANAFAVIGYALRGALKVDERAVLTTLLAQADDAGQVVLTMGQLAALAGGMKPLGAASVRTRAVPFLEAAGLISRETVAVATGRSTRWTVHPAAVQKVPRARDVTGELVPDAGRWRDEVGVTLRAKRAQVDPATREQARRAAAARVRSTGSHPAQGGPIDKIAPCDPLDRTVRSSGSGGPIETIEPTHHTTRARPYLALYSPIQPSTPYPQTGIQGAREALSAALMGIDGFQGVRVEGDGLVVEVAGLCVPSDIDAVVELFATEHGIAVRTEVDEATSQAMTAWLIAQASVRRSLTAQNFETYIGQFEPKDEGDRVVLVVDNPFLAEWVSTHYGRLLARAMADADPGIRLALDGGEGAIQLAAAANHDDVEAVG